MTAAALFGAVIPAGLAIRVFSGLVLLVSKDTVCGVSDMFKATSTVCPPLATRAYESTFVFCTSNICIVPLAKAGLVRRSVVN